MKIRIMIPVAISLICFAGSASAYVGPGAGITVIGALWGLIAGVAVAIGVILFWPIRMMLRKRKANKEALVEDADSEQEAAAGTTQANTESSQSS